MHIPGASQDTADSGKAKGNREDGGGARRDRTDDLLLAKRLFCVAHPSKTDERRDFFVKSGQHSEPAYDKKRYGLVRLNTFTKEV